jgi:hypothetical protein
MAAKKTAAKRKSKDVKCKMVPVSRGLGEAGKKVRRCFKGGKFVKTPKRK